MTDLNFYCEKCEANYKLNFYDGRVYQDLVHRDDFATKYFSYCPKCQNKCEAN